MSRTLLAAVALLIAPLAAQAQSKTNGSGFGGGFKSQPAPAFLQPLPQIQPIAPITPIAPFGVRNTGFSAGFNRPGQFRPGGSSFVGGFGGWFPYYGYGFGGYGYGYGMPYRSTTVNVYPAYYVPVGPAEPDIQLSGLANATLVLQFPADAEVWLDGKKGDGEPQTEWTLTSPALPTGKDYLFDVKARWKKNGKTYEYDKTVAVAAGHRSRSLVLSGTEIKE